MAAWRKYREKQHRRRRNQHQHRAIIAVVAYRKRN